MQNRVDFVDWLKAVGMFLIVFGHFFGEPFDQFTSPIYPKQLGVAFFIFVMGWGLASESRPRWQAVYNRLFPMYFWGIIIALSLSVLFQIFQGHPAITNYLPFIAGINVLANFFPSNPTTWYIGTYLHVLLFWALLMRKVTVTLPVLVIVLIAEITIRTIWIDIDRLFTGYMLITNWLSVFVFGMYMRQQNDAHNLVNAGRTLLMWALFLFLWANLIKNMNVNTDFPFKSLPGPTLVIASLLTSCAISFVYLINTLFAVKLFSYLPANSVVRFFSRNTIFIFIVHMPLYAVAEPFARMFVEKGWDKRAIIVFIMYVGLAVVSELLQKAINTNKIKQKLWLFLSSKGHAQQS